MISLLTWLCSPPNFYHFYCHLAPQRRPLLLNELLTDQKYQHTFIEQLQRMLHHRPWPSLPYEKIQGPHHITSVVHYAENQPQMFLSAVDHGQLWLAKRFLYLTNPSVRHLFNKALMIAIQKGYTKFATDLLDEKNAEEKRKLVAQKNNEGLTALDYAVMYNRVQILENLCDIARGLDNQQEAYTIFKNALLHACQYGRNECIRVLYPCLKYYTGQNFLQEAFAQAVNYSQRETMQVLLGLLFDIPSVSPIELAASSDNARAGNILHHRVSADSCHRMLERDETLDVPCEISHVLEIALINGDVLTLKILFEYYKVVPEPKPKGFLTNQILLCIALEQHPELVRCILTHGTIEDKSKLLNDALRPYLLQISIKNNLYDATAALLEHGALLQTPDDMNFLGLAVLMRYNNNASTTNLITLILKYARKQNCLEAQLTGFKKYFDARTPTSNKHQNFNHLCYAAHYGTLELVMLLIVSGSDIAYKDGRGRTIEQIAREAGNIDIAEHIEKLKRANPAVIWARRKLLADKK